MQVYLQVQVDDSHSTSHHSQSSRSIILINNDSTTSTTSSHSAIIFSTASNLEGRSTAAPRAIVQLTTTDQLDMNNLVSLSNNNLVGCLGLINVGSDIFLALANSSLPIGSIRPNCHVQRLLSVSFYSLTKSSWDDTSLNSNSNYDSDLEPHGSDYYQQTQSSTSQSQGTYEHPCSALKKLLSSGSFYFSKGREFDLSSRVDEQTTRKADFDNEEETPEADDKDQDDEEEFKDDLVYDERFVWNSYLVEPILHFRSRLLGQERKKLDREGMIIFLIQGYVGVYSLPIPGSVSCSPNSQSTIALVSRLSWKRAGTRFNTRGIDDDGNVANFVESETIFCHDNVIYSYAQVRGSVPLFWEQGGLQALNARIQITRPRVASQPSFDRHFGDLINHYSHVHALNLLGTRDAETVLTNAYAEHVRFTSIPSVTPSTKDGAQNGELKEEEELENLGLTNFDFHSISRSNGQGLDGVRDEIRYLGPVQIKKKEFGYTILHEGKKLRRQKGVFRTNCLDCLDRTNVVQDMLSQSTLESFVESAASRRSSFEVFKSSNGTGAVSNLAGSGAGLWSNHRVLWAENGDALSKIYAGTGALNSSFTRSGKKTLGGLLSDAAKSAGRMYINNFQDKGKQAVIDILLGNMANQKPVTIFDPIHDAMTAELHSRLDEYSTATTISIYSGTFNLNGKPPGESLLPWINPPGQETEPDIFVFAFQEIVQLTPQQILLTDPDKIRIWENALVDTLARRSGKKSDYVILRSEQLVGTALIILVKENLVENIRQVEATTKKTGLKGMSGNKGGVAIRMTFHDSSLCFVTAHFAAGHSNYEERNADYWTISRGMTFQRGKTISSHDHIIWLGDFNYRINLPNDTVRSLASKDDLQPLYDCDQLTRSREIGAVFPGYIESPIKFKPTYKYDNGTHTYDSSEKQRIPAWTDRVLFKGEGLGILEYGRAELRTSDHKPVYATFKAKVRVVNHAEKERIGKEILKDLGGNVGIQNYELGGDGSESEEFEDEDVPPPSSNEQAWWDNLDDSTSVSSDSSSNSDTSNAFVLLNPFSTQDQGSSRLNVRNGTKVGNSHQTLSSIDTKPPPPAVPSKPTTASTDQSSNSPLPPARPAFGRSTSYSSQKSGKSLLDDSDSEGEKL